MTFTRAQQANRKPKAPKPLKRGKPLRKMSAKRARNEAQRKAEGEAYFIGKDRPCKIRVPGICEGWATHWHEPENRAQGTGSAYDANKRVDCCLPCHRHAENNPLWSFENGMKISRYNRTTKGE